MIVDEVIHYDASGVRRTLCGVHWWRGAWTNQAIDCMSCLVIAAELTAP